MPGCYELGKQAPAASDDPPNVCCCVIVKALDSNALLAAQSGNAAVNIIGYPFVVCYPV